MVERGLRISTAPSWSATMMFVWKIPQRRRSRSLAPADEGKTCTEAARQTRLHQIANWCEHALDVTHDAVETGQRPALTIACAKDVAQETGIADAHGVDHGMQLAASLRLRCGWRSATTRIPAWRGLRARGHEAQRKGRPDQPRLSGAHGLVPRIQTFRRPFLSKARW